MRESLTAFETYRQENRAAHNWLMYYDERKREHTERVNAIAEGYSSPLGRSDGGVNGSGVSDPTLAKVQKLEDYTRQGKWVQLIQEVEGEPSTKMRIFLRLRREHRHCRGPNGWVFSVQRQFAEEVALLYHNTPEENWKSERQLRDYWDEIVDYTARAAIRRQLFD